MSKTKAKHIIDILKPPVGFNDATRQLLEGKSIKDASLGISRKHKPKRPTRVPRCHSIFYSGSICGNHKTCIHAKTCTNYRFKKVIPKRWPRCYCNPLHKIHAPSGSRCGNWRCDFSQHCENWKSRPVSKKDNNSKSNTQLIFEMLTLVREKPEISHVYNIPVSRFISTTGEFCFLVYQNGIGKEPTFINAEKEEVARRATAEFIEDIFTKKEHIVKDRLKQPTTLTNRNQIDNFVEDLQGRVLVQISGKRFHVAISYNTISWNFSIVPNGRHSGFSWEKFNTEKEARENLSLKLKKYLDLSSERRGIADKLVNLKFNETTNIKNFTVLAFNTGLFEPRIRFSCYPVGSKDVAFFSKSPDIKEAAGEVADFILSSNEKSEIVEKLKNLEMHELYTKSEIKVWRVSYGIDYPSHFVCGQIPGPWLIKFIPSAFDITESAGQVADYILADEEKRKGMEL